MNLKIFKNILKKTTIFCLNDDFVLISLMFVVITEVLFVPMTNIPNL